MTEVIPGLHKVVAYDSSGNEITPISAGTGPTNLAKAEDAAHASGDVGIEVLSRRTDTPLSSAGTTGDYATIDTGAFGQVWTGLVNPSDGSTVTFAPGPSLTSRLLSAANSTNSTLVKNAAGFLYNIQGYNAAAAVRYLKLYNKATAPTVGTDVPVKTIALAPSSGFALDWPTPYSFSIGIGFGLTNLSADNDTTAVTAADIVGLNLDYS